MKIFIKVKPAAGKNKVEKIDESHYKVWVTKVPEKGKANKAVISVLSKHFNLSKSKIIIISGGKSSSKIIEVS